MKYLFIVLSTLLSFASYAEVLYGVEIKKIYAQSTTGASTAHLVQLGHDLPDECHVDRVYVEFEDSDMFSVLLAKHIAGETVDLIYSTGQPAKTAEGHIYALTCKLVSVF